MGPQDHLTPCATKPQKRENDLDKPAFSPNVNFGHNYIFIHVPKSAGTSLAEALGMPYSNHHIGLTYKKKLGPRYDQMFKFCIVRNPWDRFLSLYDYARLPESYHHSALDPKTARHGKHPDFERIKNLSLKDCARLLNQGVFEQRPSLHWHQQTDWFTDSGGKIIVDYIGRYEELGKTIDHIAKTLNIEINLSHLNRSRSSPVDYRQRIDQETAELIRTYYAKDLKLLGYTF